MSIYSNKRSLLVLLMVVSVYSSTNSNLTIASTPQDDEPANVRRTFDKVNSVNIGRLNTTRFVYGYDKETHGASGGNQGFGGLDKVGVCKAVHETHQDLESDLVALGKKAKANREKFLKANKISLSHHFSWKVLVAKVKTEGSRELYEVHAAIGNDKLEVGPKRGYPTWATMMELWEKGDKGKPKLVSRKLMFSHLKKPASEN